MLDFSRPIEGRSRARRWDLRFAVPDFTAHFLPCSQDDTYAEQHLRTARRTANKRKLTRCPVKSRKTMSPSMLEDPAIAAFRYSTAPPPPSSAPALPHDLGPCTFLLRDHTPATVYPITSPAAVPIGLLAFLCDELNIEIERGETFPMLEPLPLDAFQSYWFSSFAAIMLLGDAPAIMDNRNWSKECFGSFYIKPNYPGRSAHICSAGFIVPQHVRSKGIGRVLGECYIDWAPKLGYTYSVFNLVFETNVAARRIWESIGFKRIGRVKGAAILKNHEHPVDAIMYGRDLVGPVEDPVGELRFDRIKFYLETGRYPPQADRQEKSRLRSSAAHYRLRDGRLMLRDREVVPEPERQLAIATQIHLNGHVGINKTTATIAEKYHWTRIKETAAAAIRLCSECRDNSRPPPRKLSATNSSVPGMVESTEDDLTASLGLVGALDGRQGGYSMGPEPTGLRLTPDRVDSPDPNDPGESGFGMSVLNFGE